jgi:uncharacterized protein YegP (UPF0339 family)
MNKPVFRVYEWKQDVWVWELRAANGVRIASSPQGYPRKRNAERARDAVYLAIFEAGEATK